MSEFTKGKWEVQDWTEKLDGEFLPEYAVCVGDEWIADCADNEANARLIAAAPEMYDELYEALQLLRGKSSYEGDEFSCEAKFIQELMARIDGKEVNHG